MRTTTKITSALKTLAHITGTITAEGAGLASGLICKSADEINKAPADSFIGMRRDTTIKKSYAKAKMTGYNAFALDKPTEVPPSE